MLLVQLGHYESEGCAVGLLSDLISAGFPQLKILHASKPTNPVRYFAAEF